MTVENEARFALYAALDSKIARITELEAKAAKYDALVAALEYYANPANWDHIPMLGSSAVDCLQIETGKGYERARKALGTK